MTKSSETTQSTIINKKTSEKISEVKKKKKNYDVAPEKFDEFIWLGLGKKEKDQVQLFVVIFRCCFGLFY